MKNEAEKSLVEAAIGGDMGSFGQLCSRHYSAMRAVAYSVLGNHELAEDAVQEGYARALLNLRKLRQKHRFGGWLARICRNVATDMLRKERKAAAWEDFSQVATESAEDPGREAVRNALRQLSQKERELVVLRYYDNLSYEAISEVTGLSKAAINGRLHRTKQKIAVQLRKLGLEEAER